MTRVLDTCTVRSLVTALQTLSPDTIVMVSTGEGHYRRVHEVFICSGVLTPDCQVLMAEGNAHVHKGDKPVDIVML